MSKTKSPRRLSVENSITNMGFSSIREYKEWCSENNFSTSLDKSQNDLTKEKNYKLAKEKASLLSKIVEQKKNPDKTLSLILDGKLDSDEIKDFDIRGFALKYEMLPLSEYKQSLKRLIEFLKKKINIFDIVQNKKTFLDALFSISPYIEDWVRNPEDWRIPSHNIKKQFSSFVRYLFCKYDVPLFMDSVWFGNSEYQQEWFIHIGQGQNIRTAKFLPAPLTKKAAHHFLLAPDDCSPVEALRYGWICAMGGNGRLFNALRPTRCKDFANYEFWDSIIRFFIANPMLDTIHIGPIIDYIHNEKFVSRRAQVARGVFVDELPPQANFSIKGRTVETLLAQTEKWHHSLGKEKKIQHQSWEKSKIKDCEFETGDEKNRKLWIIKELLSTSELMEEGRKMSHCVGSYSSSCASGRVAIFTLEKEENKQIQKLLTIEVDLATKEIVQARGKRNVKADVSSSNMVKKFASQAGLNLAKYCLI